MSDNENKRSISQGQSYREIGEFWDSHDVTDYWAQTEPVEFEVDIQSDVSYFALEQSLAVGLVKIARQRGVSLETLVNLWLQQKLDAEGVHSDSTRNTSIDSIARGRRPGKRCEPGLPAIV